MANKRGEQKRDVSVMKTKFVSYITLLWDSAGAIIENHHFSDSIVASIPACHAGDRGSIPRQRDI